MGYTFNRQAIQVKQGNLTLYLTKITPRDMVESGVDFCSADLLDPKRPVGDRGVQRLIVDKKVKQIKDYLNDAKTAGPDQHYLPTAVLLATDKAVDWNGSEISIPVESFPLSIVDGQHRLRGLIDAYTADITLADYELPVSLITGLGKVAQKLEFTKVNTQQEALSTAMRQQITSDLTEMQGFKSLPYIPAWLRNQVERGTDYQALAIVKKFNTDPNSPIKGRILMANKEKKRGVKTQVLNQSSLVTGLKAHILHSHYHPLAITLPAANDKAQAMLNYMIAMDKMLVKDSKSRQKTMLYRGGGMRCNLMMSAAVFIVLEQCYPPERRYTVESMCEVLKASFDELEVAEMGLADPEWWMPGAGKVTSSMNISTAKTWATAFHQAAMIGADRMKNESGQGDPPQAFGF